AQPAGAAGRGRPASGPRAGRVHPGTPGKSAATAWRLLSSQSGGSSHPDDIPGADGTPGPHHGAAADGSPTGQPDCPWSANQNRRPLQNSDTPAPRSEAECGAGLPTTPTWILAAAP